MCGICGVKHFDGKQVESQTLEAMNQTITHRGPNGDGFYLAGSLGLAMRRLSVIDLEGSDQPLYNEDCSIAVVFNGELYNFRENRNHLQAKGHQFRTDGDGETITHLYEEHGADFVHHLSGQFAIALWDSPNQRLLLTRDRFGQKPLYYYCHNQSLIFGSEIKAILAHPDVQPEAIFDDPQNLALYLGYGYVPAPMTAFKHIQMLEPGSMLIAEDGMIRTYSYWSLPPQVDDRVLTTKQIEQLKTEIHDRLYQAVEKRMIADVPLGAFLSGGLDSSLIVAMMKKMTDQPIKTFSIGFEGDDSFDETSYAQQVAELLGTEHTTFRVKPDALDLLDKLVWHYDQPFADSSAIPTYLVSQLTREQVTVAMTGDGGDELFAGYERFYAASLVKKLGFIPKSVWQNLAQGLGRLPEGTGYYNVLKRGQRFLRGASQPLTLAYFDWVRLFDAEWIHTLVDQEDIAGTHFSLEFSDQPNVSQILDVNVRTYLPDDLLIKADRCSMAASLESRAPFLDHELAEFVSHVPINLKLKGRTTKYILKELARSYLPDTIIDRKKHGFGVPLGAWLKKDDASIYEILTHGTLQKFGGWNQQAILQLLDEHQTQKRDHGFRIWTLLTLESWFNQWL